MSDFDHAPGGTSRQVADRGCHPVLESGSSERASSSWDSYSGSARSYDTIEDLLERFTLDFRPEYTLKLRNRVGRLIVGADASHLPDSGQNCGALVVKPADPAAWWRRLRVCSDGEVTLRTRKLQWWVFTLDLEGHVNPLRHTTDAAFRVATKWDVARGQFRNKKRVTLGKATEGRLHWTVNYNLPELAGTVGASARRVSRDMRADMGYAHAEVPKVELVVWPWRNNPKALGGQMPRGVVLEEGASPSDGPEEAAGTGTDRDVRGSDSAPRELVEQVDEPFAARSGAGAGEPPSASNPLLPEYLTGGSVETAPNRRQRRQQQEQHPVLWDLRHHLRELTATWPLGGGRSDERGTLV